MVKLGDGWRILSVVMDVLDDEHTVVVGIRKIYACDERNVQISSEGVPGFDIQSLFRYNIRCILTCGCRLYFERSRN